MCNWHKIHKNNSKDIKSLLYISALLEDVCSEFRILQYFLLCFTILVKLKFCCLASIMHAEQHNKSTENTQELTEILFAHFSFQYLTFFPPFFDS